MARIENDVHTVCDGCGKPLGEDDDAHYPHDRGCQRGHCQCDNATHPECCWECER